MSLLATLVGLGLYKDLLASGIALTLANLLAWHPWHKHRKRQEKLIDLMDDKTPGGMGELVAQLKAEQNRGKDEDDKDDDDEGGDAPDAVAAHHLPRVHDVDAAHLMITHMGHGGR